MQNVHYENKVNILNRPQDPMLLCAVTLVTHSPRFQSCSLLCFSIFICKMGYQQCPYFSVVWV